MENDRDTSNKSSLIDSQKQIGIMNPLQANPTLVPGLQQGGINLNLGPNLGGAGGLIKMPGGGPSGQPNFNLGLQLNLNNPQGQQQQQQQQNQQNPQGNFNFQPPLGLPGMPPLHGLPGFPLPGLGSGALPIPGFKF